MTQLFLSHSHDDTPCAERIRLDLEAQGYTVWKDSQNITPGSPSYVRAIETGIRGSAATLVLWSAHAAASEWVERELLYTQQLQKPIYPVYLDATPPGLLLVATQYVKSVPPCADAVSQLLPSLPPLDSTDAVQQIAALLAHPYIRERRKGIRHAEDLLKQGKSREKLLALLEDVARKDLIPTVQEDAQRLIDAERQKDVPPVRPDESRHIFQVRCPNGHVSHFDRRRVCPNDGTFQRHIVQRGGGQVDEIQLKCDQCDAEMVVPVDCEGYR